MDWSYSFGDSKSTRLSISVSLRQLRRCSRTRHKGTNLLRWLRQGSAVLFWIVFSIVVEGAAFNNEASGLVIGAKTPGPCAGPPKYAPAFDIPIKEQPDQCLTTSRGSFEFELDGVLQRLASGNGHVRQKSFFVLRQVRNLPVGQHYEMPAYLNNKAWTSAAIFKPEFNGDWFVSGSGWAEYQIEGYTAPFDDRPFQLSEGVFRDGGLFLGSQPESVSGTIENVGESGYRKSAESNDVVVVDVAPNDVNASEDRFMHGGAGIISGIIFGAVFLAYQYARGKL